MYCPSSITSPSSSSSPSSSDLYIRVPRFGASNSFHPPRNSQFSPIFPLYPDTQYCYHWPQRRPERIKVRSQLLKRAKMPDILLRRKMHGRVRTSSIPMGSCISNFQKGSKEESSIVHVHQGFVEGYRLKTPKKTICDVFLGIPYAKPPIGQLRFQKPQPPDLWDGVRKCTKYPNRSIHKEMPWDKALPSAPQSEDCLYLNVFAPKIEPEKKYPVLFYIHGGGWMMDSAERYTPKNICRLLVSRDIIVVTMHYRLGFLGFLSTGDDVCPGNFGLFDMLEALKWTYANISAFGGDPENITLSGQSAGAAAADTLSFSPLARGLFKRKILMGGNSYCHWATTKNEEIREYCRKKAIKLGWKPNDYYANQKEESRDILKFYQELPASKLGTTMFFSKVIFNECKLPLAPVIDGDLLPYSLNILRETQPHMPTIIGGGKHESLLFFAIGLLRGSNKEISNAFDVLSKKSGLPRSKIEEMTKKMYGDSSALRADSKLRKKFFVNLVSDIFVNYANYKFIRDSQAMNVDCYGYSFDYQSKQLWGWLQHVVPFTGGTHTSDVSYLFDCNYMAAPLGMNKTDRKMSETTAEYFCNFVKFGTPNGIENSSPVDWEPVRRDDQKIRLFSMKPDPEMDEMHYGERMAIYENNIDSLICRKTSVSPENGYISLEISESNLRREPVTVGAD